jgi:hypothetical protein
MKKIIAGLSLIALLAGCASRDNGMGGSNDQYNNNSSNQYNNTNSATQGTGKDATDKPMAPNPSQP